MPSYEDRYHAAREEFFAQHPEILAEIESIDVSVIEACGVTVEDYRRQQRYAAFSKAAERRRLDLDEFVILLVSESPQQAHEWRLKSHRRMAEVLGVDWADYKTMNRLKE